MRISLMRRLLRRHKPQPLVPILWREQRIHELIAADVVADPDMCEPLMGRPTAHITRVVYQGETMADWEKTRTMQTAIQDLTK